MKTRRKQKLKVSYEFSERVRAEQSRTRVELDRVFDMIFDAVFEKWITAEDPKQEKAFSRVDNSV